MELCGRVASVGLGLLCLGSCGVSREVEVLAQPEELDLGMCQNYHTGKI